MHEGLDLAPSRWVGQILNCIVTLIGPSVAIQFRPGFPPLLEILVVRSATWQRLDISQQQASKLTAPGAWCGRWRGGAV